MRDVIALVVVAIALNGCASTPRVVAVPEVHTITQRVPVAVDPRLTAELPVYERRGSTVGEYKIQADANTERLREANDRLRAIARLPDAE